MKEYMLIAKEDLLSIGLYLDRIADLFPTDSIPELKTLKSRAYDALGSAQPAGQEGLVHAKLDAILADVSFIADKKRMADAIAGPVVIDIKGPLPAGRIGNLRPASQAHIPQGGIFEDRVIGGAGDPEGEFRSRGEDDFDDKLEV